MKCLLTGQEVELSGMLTPQTHHSRVWQKSSLQLTLEVVRTRAHAQRRERQLRALGRRDAAKAPYVGSALLRRLGLPEVGVLARELLKHELALNAGVALGQELGGELVDTKLREESAGACNGVSSN